MRNAVEAGILAGGCALLVFKLPLSLTGMVVDDVVLSMILGRQKSNVIWDHLSIP